ncbi:MAG: Xaa-Pro peptidase family protein [Candidatus Marinimicrobia bacterium]|nr:Xaa-Pro peptidase family protein [Candidatus Neomarinimicrobiota bacterium]
MQKEKIKQAIEILEELNIDLWITFVRESETIHDPCLDMIVGTNCTWQSAFMVSRNGKTIAIIGSLDKERIKNTGVFDDIRVYVSGIGESLISAIRELNPKEIAINTSINDHMSDGLTHGMYETLMEYLSKAEFDGKMLSSEKIISALRGRKSVTELERIKASIAATEEIYSRVSTFMKPGMSEKNVADFILDCVYKQNLETSWEENSCPAVFTGPFSAGAHADPTARTIEKGHVLNIDFGAKKDGYCSDIQRTWYFLRDGEKEAPEPVMRGFNTIIESVQKTAEAICPGKMGCEIDDVARNYILSRGYPEFQHGTGHQVGRSTHDGAGGLSPRWERYGETPFYRLEEGQVYTIEPRLPIDGYGVATVEEMIVVTKNGFEWLSHPQKEILLIG